MSVTLVNGYDVRAAETKEPEGFFGHFEVRGPIPRTLKAGRTPDAYETGAEALEAAELLGVAAARALPRLDTEAR